MVARGESVRDVAKVLGVGKDTVARATQDVQDARKEAVTEAVASLVKAGVSVRETAEIVGISKSEVSNLSQMRQNGQSESPQPEPIPPQQEPTKPKSEPIILDKQGVEITPKTEEEYQEELRKEAIAQAKAKLNEEAVLERAKEKSIPHVARNTGESEWYTPPEYIAAATEVLGEIDLDPASCERANTIVKAKQFYSIENDGLTKEWKGKVWMNPPYSAQLIKQFSEKFAASIENGAVTKGIVLVNNATEKEWFQRLVFFSSVIVFPSGRIRFLDSNMKTGAPLQGQAILYAGKNPERFIQAFGRFGWYVYHKMRSNMGCWERWDRFEQRRPEIPLDVVEATFQW